MLLPSLEVLVVVMVLVQLVQLILVQLILVQLVQLLLKADPWAQAPYRRPPLPQ